MSYLRIKSKRMPREIEKSFSELRKVAYKSFSNIRFGGQIPQTKHWSNCKKHKLESATINNVLYKLSKFSYKHLYNNENGKEHLFVVANDNPIVPFCLDIDCKKVGTLEGALALANHLAQLLPCNSYIVPSTNGNGAHLWLYIQNNDSLRDQLVSWSNKHANMFDVEFVEGKCTPLKIKRVWKDGKVVDAKVNCGELCKLPSDLRFRLEEWKSLEVNYLSLDIKLSDPALKLNLESNRIIEKQTNSSCDLLKDQDKVWSKYLDFANDLKYKHAGCFGEFKLVDIALFANCLYVLSKNANKDGQMPRERFKWCWSELTKLNDGCFAWHNNKFVLLRKAFEKAGLLDMHDNNYWFSSVEGKQGVAMKWCGSNIFMEQLVLVLDKRESIYISSVLLNKYITDCSIQIIPTDSQLCIKESDCLLNRERRIEFLVKELPIEYLIAA